MDYAVALRLDAAGDTAVRAIWQAVADAGIGDYMVRLNYSAHLTLAVIDGNAPLAAIEAGFDALAGGLPVALRIGDVRRFGGKPVVWLATEGGPRLTGLHRVLVAGLPEETVHPHYRADVSVPHITLYHHGGRPDEAEAMARARWLPRQTSGDQLDLVRFPPVVVLRSITLGTKKEAPAETGAL